MKLKSLLKELKTYFKDGFTIIEILIVVGIIAGLGALITISGSDARKNARDIRRIEDLRQLRTALELYYDNNKSYPSSLGELAPSFIPVVSRDPFGTPYRYMARGLGSVCGSYHLGANLETAHNALGGDSDAEPAQECTGSTTDFSGKDVATCGGTVGEDRCYDIVSEIFALAPMQ